MRREGGLSKLLIDILLPLCVWGLMSMLLLHLIEIRSIFIQGGERNLRQATLAFAAAIILLQRLVAKEGRDYSRTMKLAVGIVIALFALDHAYRYHAPVNKWIIFFVTCALYAILWWVGDKITAACAIDSPEDVTEAAESGIFSKLKKAMKRGEPAKALADDRVPEDREADPRIREEKPDKATEGKWSEKITGKHPGIVLLYFSLFAIPAFGLGMLLYEKGDYAAHIRLAIFVFIYVWCAFSLLCLASLNQFRAYLEQRNISLPEQAGLTWLGLGFSLLTIVVVLAFFIPQPPSPSSYFVRTEVMGYWGEKSARYRESKRGKAEMAKQRGKKNMQADEPISQKQINRKRNEMYWRKMVKEEVGEPYMMDDEQREKFAKDLAQPGVKAFHGFINVIVVIAFVGAVFVILAVLLSAWTSIRDNVAKLRWMRKKSVKVAPRKKRKRQTAEELALAQFRRFSNPFTSAYSDTDGNAVVRYTWMAFVAMCADAGAPCAPERTPKEFVAEKPEPLKGFEEPAEFIARLYTFSEFSGQDVEPSAMQELKEFWAKLQNHARTVIS